MNHKNLPLMQSPLPTDETHISRMTHIGWKEEERRRRKRIATRKDNSNNRSEHRIRRCDIIVAH